MLDWKPLQLADRDWIDPLIHASDFRGCEYSFGTIFLWRHVFHTKVAQLEDRLLLRSGSKGNYSYLFPPGIGDLKGALLALEEDAKMEEQPFWMHSVNEQSRAELETLFPGRYFFAPIRSDFDYIYTAQSLVALKGKKLHGKRNHINRFLAQFENRWSYEQITPENLPECMLMNQKWCLQNECALDESKQREQCAVKEAFANYFDLHLIGGLLRVDQQVVAFTIGEPLNSDTLLVHIEKAFTEYHGAYPMINQQFILANGERFLYVNREDDTGSEGLRKAKLSYHPAFLETKFRVCKESELTVLEWEKFETGQTLHRERITV